MSKKKSAAAKIERRCYSGQEFRAVELKDGGKAIEGHPAVYNRSTEIAGLFKEIIMPGAFDGADMTDVPLLVNHDMRKLPLARSRRNNGNSTMRLSTDSTGLVMSAKVDIEGNAEAQQLYSAVQRGDVDGMSFAFSIKDAEWEDLDSDMPTRRIKAFSKIYEVSAVTWPAYKDTDINARADEETPDGAARTLESARAKAALENAEQRASKDAEAIEILKIRNRIYAGGI